MGARKLLWGWFCIMFVIMSFAVVSESRIPVDRKQNLADLRQRLVQVHGGAPAKVVAGKYYTSSKRYIPGGPDPRHH